MQRNHYYFGREGETPRGGETEAASGDIVVSEGSWNADGCAVMIGYGRGGGGGGGFGGFPYRSSHRQGQDGRGRGGAGRGRGRRQKRPQKRSDGGISYHAELQVPPHRRGRIVGRGGAALGKLREETRAKIFVPRQRWPQQRGGEDDGQRQESGPADNDDVHPVRVSASGLPDLLHAFYEIRTLLSRDENAGNDATVSCLVKMRGPNSGCGTDNRDGTEVRVDGLLIVSSARSISAEDGSGSLLFRGTAAAPQQEGGSANASSNEASIDAQPRQQLLAYAVESPLSEDDVATAVDNLRFVNASDVEGCQWFYRRPILRNVSGADDGAGGGGAEAAEAAEATALRGGVVLVFGAEGSNPQAICRAIKEAA